jgi:hypothetical protein
VKAATVEQHVEGRVGERQAERVGLNEVHRTVSRAGTPQRDQREVDAHRAQTPCAQERQFRAQAAAQVQDALAGLQPAILERPLDLR